jgi:peptidoglycan LD-endopeptidase CwlK
MASRNLADLDNYLSDVFQKAKADFEAQNPNFEVRPSATYRSPAEQWDLFQKGRTKPGPRVTNCDGKEKLSKHNFMPAKAIDVFFVNRTTKAADWTDPNFNKFAPLMAKHDVAKKIIWGGNFKSLRDLPHFEI